MKNYHTFKTNPKYNQKTIETEAKSIAIHTLHDPLPLPLSWFGVDAPTKVAELSKL